MEKKYETLPSTAPIYSGTVVGARYACLLDSGPNISEGNDLSLFYIMTHFLSGISSMKCVFPPTPFFFGWWWWGGIISFSLFSGPNAAKLIQTSTVF